MDGLRFAVEVACAPNDPCSRCRAAGCPWDRIGDMVLCPDCQESIALGDGPALRAGVEPRPCAGCERGGTLCYLTYPLHSERPLEIDLCARCFPALLGRRLEHGAYHRLLRRLRALGVSSRQVFLLHEAFYDETGRPLQPVPEPW